MPDHWNVWPQKTFFFILQLVLLQCHSCVQRVFRFSRILLLFRLTFGIPIRLHEFPSHSNFLCVFSLSALFLSIKQSSLPTKISFALQSEFFGCRQNTPYTVCALIPQCVRVCTIWEDSAVVGYCHCHLGSLLHCFVLDLCMYVCVCAIPFRSLIRPQSHHTLYYTHLVTNYKLFKFNFFTCSCSKWHISNAIIIPSARTVQLLLLLQFLFFSTLVLVMVIVMAQQ